MIPLSLLSVSDLGGCKVEHIKVDRLLPGVGSNDVSDLLDSSETGEVVVNLQGLGFISGRTLVTTQILHLLNILVWINLNRCLF